jgi:hypothetical protein
MTLHGERRPRQIVTQTRVLCEIRLSGMVVYCGFARETEVPVAVIDRGCGAGEIDCIECGGTGWWGFGPTEAETGPCVECKGTGRALVSIA